MQVFALRFFRLVLLVLFIFTFVLGSGSLIPTQRLEAQETRSGHEFIYYNDANHDEIVGVYVYCKDGADTHSGRISPYVVVEPSDC